MADSAPGTPNDKPQRSAADKERSRQQSRAVSGKEAARTVGRSGKAGQRAGDTRRNKGRDAPQGQRAPKAAPKGPQGRNTARTQPAAGRPGTQRAGARNQRSGNQRSGNRPRSATPRNRTALFTWGAVGLVVVIVGVLLAVNLGSSKTAGNRVTPEPVPATIMSEVSHIPASVFNSVGTGSAAGVRAPLVKTGQPLLQISGKPGYLYVGGEFCPFCAAERWAQIAALSRFGTLRGVETMSSASTDVDASTPTFSFAHAAYKSPYIGASLVEWYGQNAPTGKHTINQKPTATQTKLITKYDNPTSPTQSGSIPFVDIGNKLIVSGASYTPQLLQGQTRTQIAADLSHPNNPVAQAIAGTANYLTAGICSVDNGAPSSVCSSAGVKAAAKALGIST